VNTTSELKSSMANAKPGDDIIIASGKYAIGDDYKFEESGVNDCPIVMTSDGIGTVTLIGSLHISSIYYLNISDISFEATDIGSYFYRCSHIGFTNVHAGGGISFQWASDITIHNCTFDRTKYDGLSFDYSSNAVVEESLFADGITSSAIAIDEHSSGIIIRSNSFYGSGYVNDYPTWISTYSGKNEIYYNHFLNTDQHEMFAGIIVLNSVPNIIRDNFMVFYPSKLSPGVGISVYHDQKVCASNKVFGGLMTDGIIDPSC